MSRFTKAFAGGFVGSITALATVYAAETLYIKHKLRQQAQPQVPGEATGFVSQEDIEDEMPEEFEDMLDDMEDMFGMGGEGDEWPDDSVQGFTDEDDEDDNPFGLDFGDQE